MAETTKVSVFDLVVALVRGKVSALDIAEGLGLQVPAKYRSQPAQLGTLKGHQQSAFSEALKAELRREKQSKKLGHEKSEGRQSVGDVVDGVAERAVQRTFEQPWCLEACMQRPGCQRVCFPADYATRERAAREEGAGGRAAPATGGRASTPTSGPRQTMVVGRSSSRSFGGDGGERQFGLQDWGQAGFWLLGVEEAMDHVDDLVGQVLGFQMAVHRKTSLHRFCLQQFKSKLPPGVTNQEIANLIRALKRCDHVNILNCLEVYEDRESLYFLYEYVPCCSLRYMLETHSWSQEQIVNLSRECCAAVAFASSIGLTHLGWTTCHVLLPTAAANGHDPVVAKVFGFGLLGVIVADTPDRLCWGPECLERFRVFDKEKETGTFVAKMDTFLRQCCDSWSLGVITYTLVSRQLPMTSEQAVLQKQWQFTLDIDAVDPEAKSLIEALLNPVPERRLKPERALHHEWIRRRWRPPSGGEQVFAKLEDFCMAPLPKRLFGRFLTRYLDAGHLRKIARNLYSLDTQGSGVVGMKEIRSMARLSGRHMTSATLVCNWLMPAGATNIPLMRLAEAFAEEVIDGRALRLAFELLDDDGSEMVTPEELYHALRALDDTVTMEEVVDHIESAELEVGSEGQSTKDHKIDFTEFCQLFPVRVRRMREISERADTERAGAEDLINRFRRYAEPIEEWLDKLQQMHRNIAALSSKTLERSESAKAAAHSLRSEMFAAQEHLRNPPGPSTAGQLHQQRIAARGIFNGRETTHHGHGHSKKQVVPKQISSKSPFESYGFDSFIQEMSIVDAWHVLLEEELRSIKLALGVTKSAGNVDLLRAHDAAEGTCIKLVDLLQKAFMQLREYEAFTEAMDQPEVGLSGTTGVQLSGRGLRQREGEEHHHNEMAAAEDEEGSRMMRLVHEAKGRFKRRSLLRR